METLSIEAMQSQEHSPVIVVDHEGMITALNRRFEQVFRWRASDLVGRMLSTIIPKNLRDAHHLGFSRFLLTERATILGRPLELIILTGDGEARTARHYIVAEKQNSHWRFAATIRDMESMPNGVERTGHES